MRCSKEVATTAEQEEAMIRSTFVFLCEECDQKTDAPKLYIWRPDGHGSYTFSVVAENKQAAFGAVDAFVKEKYGVFYPDFPGKRARVGQADIITLPGGERWDYKYEANGWNTEYYKLEVYDIGKVVEHENEWAHEQETMRSAGS